MHGEIMIGGSARRVWQRDLCQFFTRAEVARYCLQQLTLPANILTIKLLEPAAGHGAFFLPLIPRLANACRAQKCCYNQLRNVISAYEIDPDIAELLRKKSTHLLEVNGIPISTAKALGRSWIKNEDFLEANLHSDFSHIISNPPYIRWEAIPVKLRRSYRKRFSSFKQRADLYVAFIERALELLRTDGQLGFLCPGTWTKNGYGSSIRETLTSRGYLKKIIDFSDVDSFEQSADAYPCFFLFQKDRDGSTEIFAMIDGKRLSRTGDTVRRRFEASSGPLLLSRNNGIVHVLKRAEEKFPKVEDSGCSVRVGSATGCNEIFLGLAKDLPVEKDRLLPFVNARSIRNGTVEWSGTSIVNVFDDSGALVKLAQFPRLRAYLEAHKESLKARAKASKSKTWWRSIDVLHSEWHRSRKLLVVDISAKPVIGLDAVGYCAGSGVYQIKSDSWPLDDLLVLLSAGVLGLFISALSVGANKSFHRFQKRHICNIRLPKWQDLDQSWRSRFQTAHGRGHLSDVLEAVAELYECEPKLLQTYLARDWQSFSHRPKA